MKAQEKNVIVRYDAMNGHSYMMAFNRSKTNEMATAIVGWIADHQFPLNEMPFLINALRYASENGESMAVGKK